VTLEHGSIIAAADALIGADITLERSSVGATKNIMLAASRAKGVTTIRNAASEPEVCDLAEFVNAMGGRVRGHGTSVITVEGVRRLRGCEYTIIPDRLTAGTYLLAGAITAGDVRVTGVDPRFLTALSDALSATGATVSSDGMSIRVRGVEKWRPADIVTAPFPGFPTDLQPQFVAYLSLAQVPSAIEETLFDARFVYVSELSSMGADIKVSGRSAVVTGVERLKDAVVEAPDIRAGGALVIAALAAEGTSQIGGLEFIDRGYEFFEEKLASLGASIARASAVEPVMPRSDLGETIRMPRIVTPFRAS
jgi:UDP-N-acetylglucosamine 1-carboxyvinyltransferase